MAFYVFALGGAGTPAYVRDGWSIQETANGRNSLTVEIPSPVNVAIDPNGLRPSLDDYIIVYEGVNIVATSGTDPTIILCQEPHRVIVGQKVYIQDIPTTGSPHPPDVVNGFWEVLSIVDQFSFMINVTPTGADAGGPGKMFYRIFAGMISKLVEGNASDIAGVSDTPHVTGLVTKCDAIDFNGVAERRYINETLGRQANGTTNDTLIHILTRIVALLNSPVSEGITLHPSQVNWTTNLAEIPCEFLLVQDVLDSISVKTGWLWKFDEYNRLLMYDPASSFSSPVDAGVTAPLMPTGDIQTIIGDLPTEISRVEYANRVILRFSDRARNAKGYLEIDGTTNFADGDTVVLGSATYTFNTAVSVGTEGSVKIGSGGTSEENIDQSIRNLISAINHDTGGDGVDVRFSNATEINAQASAYHQVTFSQGLGYSKMEATAKADGEAGNSVEVSVTSGIVSEWIASGHDDIEFLVDGADQALTKYVIRQSTSEMSDHRVWEVIVEAPEILDVTQAETFADAYLAAHLPFLRKVTYNTYERGLHPGQIQRVAYPRRNIDTYCLITDVNSQHEEAGLVLRSVTAIVSMKIQSTDRWRDVYKQWSDGGSGKRVLSGGSSSSQVVSGGGRNSVYWLGGSRSEWIQTPANTYEPATSVQARIDTTVRGGEEGGLLGKCWVRLAARSGTVTAQLYDVANSQQAGESVAVSSSTLQMVSFPVTLTAGVGVYEIRIKASAANVDVQLGSAYFE